MRITVATQRYIPPLNGGVDIYTHRLGRALRKLGHEVSIMAFDFTSNDDARINITQDEYEGVAIDRVSYSLSGRPRSTFDLSYDPTMGDVAGRLLKNRRPDLFIVMNFYAVTMAVVETAKEMGIIVAHIATDFLPVCRRGTYIRWDNQPCQTGESLKSCAHCFVAHDPKGRIASSVLNLLPEEMLVDIARDQSRMEKIPLVRSLDPYWHQVRTMDQRLKILGELREAIDFVLVPTKYTESVFLKNGFKAHQLVMAPFGVDNETSPFIGKHSTSDAIRFLFIGRFQPYKGAHLLIDAFNNLNSPKNSTLSIYGIEDGYEEYYRDLMEKMKSNDQILFGGGIKYQEIPQALGESDYFILPSLWPENSPLIVLDALQSETPVIASEIAGITDIIENGVNGILFPMGDQKALQETLQSVIDNPDLKSRLIKSSQLPNIESYAETIIEKSIFGT